MTHTTISIPILLSAVCAVLVFDGMGVILKSFFEPAALLAVVRACQIITFSILLITASEKKVFSLSVSHLSAGIKTGLIWSFLFGIVTILAGAAVFLAGSDPIAAVRPIIPQTDTAVFLFTMILISPIAEELFFRGIVYPFLRPAGSVTAIIITSTVFSLSHYSGETIPIVPFIGGVLFAAAFEYSKNLATPITIHILGNLAIYLTVFL